MKSHTYVEKVAQLFRSRRFKWIDGMTVAKVGGVYAWRSRIADARRRFNLPIENRQRRVGSRIKSEYRLGRRRAA